MSLVLSFMATHQRTHHTQRVIFKQQPLRLLRLADPDMPVKLAVEAANTRAQRLYRSLGFRQLPERDGDDLIFCMEENPDG